MYNTTKLSRVYNDKYADRPWGSGLGKGRVDFIQNRLIQTGWPFDDDQDVKLKDIDYYYPNDYEYGNLSKDCNPNTYKNYSLISDDLLSLFLVKNPTVGNVAPDVDYDDGQTQLVRYQDVVISNSKDVDLRGELMQGARDFRRNGLFSLKSGDYDDYKLILEIAKMFEFAVESVYGKTNDYYEVAMNGKKNYIQNPEQWFDKAILYIKNDRYPPITKRYIISSVPTEVSDFYLHYAVIDSIIHLIGIDPSKRYLLKTLNSIHVKNNYLTLELPTEQTFLQLDNLIMEFIEATNNIRILKFPFTDKNLVLNGRLNIQQSYPSLKILTFTNKNASYYVIEGENDIDEKLNEIANVITKDNIQNYRGSLVEYYNGTCLGNEDPISREEFKDMTLKELAELIIGFDISSKGRPYCFMKETLSKLKPLFINPITRVPFLDETLNQYSLSDYAISGVFDIGKFRGLLSTDFYNLDDDTTNVPGLISVDVLPDEYLYFLTTGNDSRVDLFFRRTPLDPNKLNNAWSKGKLLSPWAKQYFQSFSLLSSLPIDMSTRDTLQSPNAESFLVA